MDEINDLIARMVEEGKTDAEIETAVSNLKSGKTSGNQAPKPANADKAAQIEKMVMEGKTDAEIEAFFSGGTEAAADPVKKKEGTESKSPSGDIPSSSESSSTSDSDILPIYDIPDQIVDTEISALYDEYLKNSEVTEDQLSEIKSTIEKQASGDRGWLETAAAYAKGFMNRTYVPMFKFDSEEELIRDAKRGNQVAFLESLPEETIAKLREFAGKQADKLSGRNQTILYQNKILEEKGKDVANKLKYLSRGIKDLKESNQQIPPNMVEDYKSVYSELEVLRDTYNRNVDVIESNDEDIADFYTEADMLKKNFGGLDYYVDLAVNTGASMFLGAAELRQTAGEWVDENTPLSTTDSFKENREFLSDAREVIDDNASYLKPQKSVKDINSISDFGKWAAEQLAVQTPVLLTLAATSGVGAGNIGLGAIATSSAGQKIGDLRVERAAADEEIGYINELIESGELSEEDLLEAEGRISKLNRASEITDGEMLMAGIGSGALEFFSEKVSLGILTKGRRAYKAAKRSKDFTSFREGAGFVFSSGVKEGATEFATQVGNNLIDIAYLNDPDTHILDGTLDALASGAFMGKAMSVSPVVVGMAAKALSPKEDLASIKSDSRKAAAILGEIEARGEILDDTTKKLLKKEASSYTKAVAKVINKTFRNVAKMPKESIEELIKLDKDNNKIIKQAAAIKKSDINDEYKTSILEKLKEKSDKITEKKAELLKQRKAKESDSDHTDVEYKDESGAETSQRDPQEVKDIQDKENKRKYKIKKGENGKWVVETKGSSKIAPEVIHEADTLKDATGFVIEQGKKRQELLEKGETVQSEVFESEDTTPTTIEGWKKSLKENLDVRKLLTGIPVASFIDNNLVTPITNILENKYSSLMDNALKGELALEAKEGDSKIERAAIKITNSFIKTSAMFANAMYAGSARTAKQVASKRKFTGKQESILMEARKTGQALSELIKGDKESARRVHQVMDPELYEDKAEPISYDDLTDSEKELYDALRAINQETHEMNYRNGFISKETFDKFDGKYIGRGYEVYEELEEASKEEEILLSNTIFSKIYGNRQEMSDWLKEHTVSDPIYLTMNRYTRSQRNSVIKGYANYINETQAVKEKPKNGSWVQLNGKQYGSLSGKYLPHHIAQDFRGFFFTNQAMQSVYDALSLYNSSDYKQFMKKFHTVFSPVVQVGNLVSNLAFGFGAGINQVALARGAYKAGSSMKNQDALYKEAMEMGVLGTNVLKEDLAIKTGVNAGNIFKDAVSSLFGGGKGKEKPVKAKGEKSTFFGKMYDKFDKTAQKLYGASDDVMKLGAYIALKDAGYTKEQAAERVYEGFQNYASVGVIWDIASKTPVFGNDYIKFQGDLNRIVKNAVMKRPMGTLAFLMGLQGVATAASYLSNEEEEEKAIREGRPFIPKVSTPIGDFPLVFRVGDNEVNMARYISPYYKYDKGSSNWIDRASEFMPYQADLDEDGSLTVIPGDIALGSLVAAFIQNRDFRGKNVADPDYSIYSGSTVTPLESIWNRTKYVLRSQVPLFSMAHDSYLSSVYGEDYFGRDKSLGDVLISRVIKVQTWDSDTTKEQVLKSLKSINYEVKQVKTKESAIRNKTIKKINEDKDKFKRGEITEEVLKNRIEDHNDQFEKRLLKISEKKVEIQEKFNNLNANALSIGLDFRGILEKSRE